MKVSAGLDMIEEKYGVMREVAKDQDDGVDCSHHVLMLSKRSYCDYLAGLL